MNRRNRNHRRRSQRDRRGAAAVEFALVAPLLFLVVMASMEFGRAMLVKQIVTNASRVGAREASLPNSTTADAEAAATDYAERGGVFNPTISVTPDPAAAQAGDSVTVTVNVAYDDVSWLPSAWFMGGLNLEGVSVMRKEGFE